MATVNIDEYVEMLNKLSVLELVKLKKALEEVWEVSAMPAAPMMAAMPAGGAAEEAAPEATEFNVTLEAAPADKKIPVIKVVREITGLGLKEAKEVVEGAPKVLKENVSKEENSLKRVLRV